MNIKQALLACLAVVSGSSHGALISRDLVALSGDGLITYDQATQLEWLDLTETRNLSFDSVVAQLGGQFSGFQVASSAMVGQLFLDGGWSGNFNQNYFFDPAKFAQATNIVSLLGETTIGYPAVATYGWVTDMALTGERHYDAIYTDPTYSSAYSSAWLNAFQGAPDSARDHVGTFLYRHAAPVPEPKTYAMLLAGLGMLGIAARRRRTSMAELR